MNGSGATIALDGSSFNIDSTKLSTATNDFVSHLDTIAGNGSKVTVGDVEYSVDSNKLSGAMSELETAFGKLSGGLGESELEFELELNEYGFYYNQPYSAYVSALDTHLALILRNDGSIYILGRVGEYMESKATYSMNGNTIAINSDAFGALTATFSEDGKELYCNEVATNFVLGDDYCVADGEYVYLYFESIDGYAIFPLNRTKSSYNPIRVNINNIPTKAIASHAFDGNTNLENITIPDGIVIIDFAAFRNCTSLKNISFNGTMAQWNAVSKHSDWYSNVLATYVQCSDGQVVLTPNN